MLSRRRSGNPLAIAIVVFAVMLVIVAIVLFMRSYQDSATQEAITDQPSLSSTISQDSSTPVPEAVHTSTPPIITLGGYSLTPEETSPQTVTFDDALLSSPMSEGVALPTGAVDITLYPIENPDTATFSGSYEDFMLLSALAPATYNAEIAVSFDSPTAEGFVGTARYVFSLEVPDLAPSVTLEGPALTQGRTTILRMSGFGSETAPTISTDFGFNPVAYHVGDDWIAYIAAPYSKPVGDYNITVTAGGQNYSLPCSIGDGNFVVDEPFWVEIGPGVDVSAANAEFAAVTNPIKSEGDNTQYWQENFIVPLEDGSRITSYFGHTRTINGSTSKHSGVDLAAPIGTPVYAPQSGRVQFAGWLELTGYTVCIEHGYGLKTWFYHLDGVNIETGANVTAGDMVATVGSTGIYTTGPHLHWGMTVFGTFVDPNQYVNAPLRP